MHGYIYTYKAIKRNTGHSNAIVRRVSCYCSGMLFQTEKNYVNHIAIGLLCQLYIIRHGIRRLHNQFGSANRIGFRSDHCTKKCTMEIRFRDRRQDRQKKNDRLSDNTYMRAEKIFQNAVFLNWYTTHMRAESILSEMVLLRIRAWFSLLLWIRWFSRVYFLCTECRWASDREMQLLFSSVLSICPESACGWRQDLHQRNVQTHRMPFLVDFSLLYVGKFRGTSFRHTILYLKHQNFLQLLFD